MGQTPAQRERQHVNRNRNDALAAKTIDWLLEGDPAIRWQTMRDLAAASDQAVERERNKIARCGWGARLFARQGMDGRWAGGQIGGRRTLFAQVDFHDVHDAVAA